MHIFILQYIDIHLGKLQRPVCDLTGIMVNKGIYPQMALIQLTLYIYIYMHIFFLIDSVSRKQQNYRQIGR